MCSTDEIFDVFLCHNAADKPAIRRIATLLENRQIKPWLDEQELQPGIPWQPILEKQIRAIKSAAVFVGSNGIGPWQDIEQQAFLRQFAKRGCPIIPVILDTCQSVPVLPLFLEGMTYVDLRRPAPDPIDQLVWGITGEKPGLSPGGVNATAPSHDSEEQYFAELDKELRMAKEAKRNLIIANADQSALAKADQTITDIKRRIYRGRDLNTGTVLSERFRLLDFLGAGGFGAVWRAVDLEENESVAIKVLLGRHRGDASRKKRFAAGAEIMKSELHHPNIVRVRQGATQQGDHTYFVMEYLKGGHLEDRVRNAGLSNCDIYALILSVADGLSFAHQRKVIHRDISPSNILFDEQGQAKLSDFDLARIPYATIGSDRQIGDLRFVAPELAYPTERSEGDDFSQGTVQSDIFSLAMTTLFAVSKGTLPRSVHLYPAHYVDSLRLPSAIKKVLRRAVALEPRDRFGSVQEFSVSLRTAIADQRRNRFYRASKNVAANAHFVAKSLVNPDNWRRGFSLMRRWAIRATLVSALMAAALLVIGSLLQFGNVHFTVLHQASPSTLTARHGLPQLSFLPHPLGDVELYDLGVDVDKLDPAQRRSLEHFVISTSAVVGGKEEDNLFQHFKPRSKARWQAYAGNWNSALATIRAEKLGDWDKDWLEIMQFASDSSVDALIACLSDKRSSVQVLAIDKLATVKMSADHVKAAVEAMIPFLKSEDKDVAYHSAESLLTLDREKLNEALPVIIEFMVFDSSGTYFSQVAGRRSSWETYSRRRKLADLLISRGGSEMAAWILLNRLSNSNADDSQDVAAAIAHLESSRTAEIVAAIVPLLKEGILPSDFDREKNSGRLINSLPHTESVWSLGVIGSREPAVVIDAMKPLLANEDETTVRHALQVLGLLGAHDSESVIPALLPMLHHNSANVKLEAIRAIGRIAEGADEATEALIAMLNPEKPEMVLTVNEQGGAEYPLQAETAWALGRIHPREGDRLCLALAQLTASPVAEVRQDVCWALGQYLATHPQIIIPALIPLLKDSEYGVRTTSVEILKRAKGSDLDPFWPTLSQLLDHEESQVRSSAAKVLSNLLPSREGELVPLLVHCLMNRKNSPAVEVAAALGNVSAKQSVPAVAALLPLLRDDQQWWVQDTLISEKTRESAAAALVKLACSNQTHVLPEILKLFTDKESGVRASACLILANVAASAVVDDTAIAGLENALHDPEARVRDYAAAALGETMVFAACSRADQNLVHKQLVNLLENSPVSRLDAQYRGAIIYALAAWYDAGKAVGSKDPGESAPQDASKRAMEVGRVITESPDDRKRVTRENAGLIVSFAGKRLYWQAPVEKAKRAGEEFKNFQRQLTELTRSDILWLRAAACEVFVRAYRFESHKE